MLRAYVHTYSCVDTIEESMLKNAEMIISNQL